MYRQIDGVAMGSPLGLEPANIFVGFHEKRFLSSSFRPQLCCRYVDATFCLFNEVEADQFLSPLNSLHPAVRFTFEKESNSQLDFLDLLGHRTPTSFLTSV